MLQWRPVEDSSVDALLLARNLSGAIKARRLFPWSKDIPFDLFLNEVVPYASLTEPREMWRTLFFEKLAPCVSSASTATEAALRLNKCAWEIV